MGLEFDAVAIQAIAAQENADDPELPVRDIAPMDSARFGVQTDSGEGAAVLPALPVIEYSTFLPDSQVALLGYLIEPETLRRFHATWELDVTNNREFFPGWVLLRWVTSVIADPSVKA